VLDSGCTQHMTGDSKMFNSIDMGDNGGYESIIFGDNSCNRTNYKNVSTKTITEVIKIPVLMLP
jgi:hypothetical protein